MKTVGLTGGIGMGKSTAAAWLTRQGIPVVDTDVLARDLVEPGQPALVEIAATFGPAMLDAAGRLRRAELGRVVFGDASARARLEGILHPRIRKSWMGQVDRWRGEGCSLAVVVIPLLFEVGAETDVDRTVCVACSARTQRERLSARGWDVETMQRRMAAQWPVSVKMERSDRVIWNEGSVGLMELQMSIALRLWVT